MSDGTSETDQRFPKSARLLHRSEYLRAQRDGRRFQTPRLTILSVANSLERTRLGVTVSRKVGNSVTRSGVKRRIREIFRTNKSRWPAGVDMVVIAREPASRSDFAALAADLFAWSERASRPGR
jgi:ribonuclease P protein component